MKLQRWSKTIWISWPPPLPQGRLQLQERAQQLVRFDDIAFAVVFVRINDPAPTIARDSTAIAP